MECGRRPAVINRKPCCDGEQRQVDQALAIIDLVKDAPVANPNAIAIGRTAQLLHTRGRGSLASVSSFA